MKRLISISVYLILMFLVLVLSEANTKIMGFTNQVSIDFLGKWFEDAFPIIKAFSYSLATVIIIIYYKNIYIRLSFITLDAAIIFIYNYINSDLWYKYSAFYYAALTALIFVFIGNIAHEKYINSGGNKLTSNSINSNSELRKMELKKLIDNLKRVGRSGGTWEDYPERVEKMNEYENELLALKN